ncbi:MAG: DNA recombination protein RmuC [Gammaproteobacteria bacterium]|nr:DNA recombination protein RmuC [Gammaproteobacteria bacterium]
MHISSTLLVPSVGLLILLALLLIFVLLRRGIYLINIRLQERERSTNELRDSIAEHQLKSLKVIQESIQGSMADIRSQVMGTLNHNTDSLTKRVEKLTETTDFRLKEISGQVEKRLSEGFEKTTNIFADVVKRLALIDVAQKKITELSGNVVDLQAILSDKRSRGAFGEVQLSGLIRNTIPERNFELQYTLSNGKRADCILLLPEPTGNLVIDAKFPLESYQRLSDISLAESERRSAEQQFKVDIRKHIHDIADKYIVENETADGAMMFIPAEAVFAEIHAHYPDLVEHSHKKRVWMVSPTTMMAVLTTARAVLKDAATRKQVHVIQEHLGFLGKDFERFQKRMDDLAKHIEQANKDVEHVHKSSRKITSRFSKIEKVELEQEADAVELSEVETAEE